MVFRSLNSIFANNKNYEPMNVKFKMPKFGRKLSGKTWWKELLLTFLGTTISIVLTFGTTHFLDLRQKKAAGRQMAMMVIHDIDEGVQSYKGYAKDEKENIELAQFVLNNLDQINSIAEDTLESVYYFLLRDIGYTIDDSKEKIFHSSPETWKSIDNSKFIDIVQQFYYQRRNYNEYLNTDPTYIDPISIEDHFENVLEASKAGDLTGVYKRVLSKLLKDNRVQLFLTYSPNRQRFYEYVANRWQQMSDQCKFLMGITDDELKEYVEKINRTGRPIKERELVGKWVATSSSEDKQETIEFKKDHTFTHVSLGKLAYPAYTGTINYTLNMEGTWSLNGDSLFRTYNVGSQYAIDKLDITYPDEMKDSIQNFINHLKERFAQRNEKMKREPILGRRANALSVDRSGNKIELLITEPNDDGEEEEKAEYMSRVKK